MRDDTPVVIGFMVGFCFGALALGLAVNRTVTDGMRAQAVVNGCGEFVVADSLVGDAKFHWKRRTPGTPGDGAGKAGER